MNPLVVIPTYWSKDATTGTLRGRGAYDYTTPIDKPLPELEVCLSSLEQVRGIIRVAVLVVASTDCAEGARARVNSICRQHSNLNPLVIGVPEADLIQRAIAKVVPGLAGEAVSLRGYGAIKNLGLACACVFGHDVVVFLDDDEVALDDEYLLKAVYGLGSYNRQNLRICAKSGFYVDASGSAYAAQNNAWSEKYWSKAEGFNTVMEKAQSAARISRSSHMCGGCCALHAEAFTRVPFDPYISRGEDLDYVLNLRAFGMDVWFDNNWFVRMQPPEEMAAAPELFMQDVYRWLYEYRKLDVLNSQRYLRTITRESLMPYPAPWLFEGVRRRVFQTALRRAIVGPNRGAYLRVLTRGRAEADHFARFAATDYLSFAMMWPQVTAELWEDHYLQQQIMRAAALEPRVEARPDDDAPFSSLDLLPKMGEGNE